jgi:hypothetical protein
MKYYAAGFAGFLDGVVADNYEEAERIIAEIFYAWDIPPNIVAQMEWNVEESEDDFGDNTSERENQYAE